MRISETGTGLIRFAPDDVLVVTTIESRRRPQREAQLVELMNRNFLAGLRALAEKLNG